MTESFLLVLLICAWAWVCQVAAELFFGGR
jgi:hypothetical protein